MALNPFVSIIGRLAARSGRKRGNRQTDRQNDKTTTVTLAAHARRGLIILWFFNYNYYDFVANYVITQGLYDGFRDAT